MIDAKLALVTPISYDIGALTLRGEQFGRPGDQPVLFLHGGGQSRSSWRTAPSAIADLPIHGIALDLRGHGESDWSAEGAYRIEDVGEDAAVVLRSIDRPTILVGASLGGLGSLIAAAELSSLAMAVILVDAVPHLHVPAATRVASFMRINQHGFADLPSASAAIQRGLGTTSRPSTRSLARTLRCNEDGRWVWRWDPRVVVRAVDVAGELAAAERAAAQLDIPVTLLRGATSEVVNDSGERALRRLVPQLRTVLVPNAGHTVAGYAAVEYVRAIRDILVDVLSATGVTM